jgi:hypothetical protein
MYTELMKSRTLKVKPTTKLKKTSGKNKRVTKRVPLVIFAVAIALAGMGVFVVYSIKDSQDLYSALESSDPAKSALEESIKENESKAQSKEALADVNQSDQNDQTATNAKPNNILGTAYTVPIGVDPKTIDPNNLPPMTLSTDRSDVVFNGTVGDISLSNARLIDINSNYSITSVGFSGYDASKIRAEEAAGGQGFRMIYIYYIGSKDAPTQGATQLTITISKADNVTKSVTLPVTWNIENPTSPFNF